MVQLIKCNRCEFTGEDEDEFTQMVLSLPVVKEKNPVRRVSDLPQKWAAREKNYSKSFVGFDTPQQTRTKPSHIHHLDLCPECTAWFSKEFALSKEVSQEFLRTT